MDLKPYRLYMINGKLYGKRDLVMDFLDMKLYMVFQLTQEGVFGHQKLPPNNKFHLYDIETLLKYKKELEEIE